MRRTVSLKRGLNLSLAGEAPQGAPSRSVVPRRVALVPDDYPGFLPKLEVAEGDTVKAGDPLMRHKEDADVKLVAPAGGRVEAVVRGARRKIERVVVAVDPDAEPARFDTHEPLELLLKRSGLWAMMRQRPYDIVPSGAKPVAVMVTAFDSAPLAPDMGQMVADRRADLEAGAKALSTLCPAIYLGVPAGSALPDLPGVETVEFPMLHPAGNAGVQLANIRPVNKGETAWTLSALTLARIGRLVRTGELDCSATVALTGSELKEPAKVATVIGADMQDLLGGNIKDDGRHHRVISGNVLTGIPVGADGFLRYPYTQVTVIPEGDDVDEFMGWASMSPAKMSVNRSFIGHLLGGRKYTPDARICGGRRAMIMSGQYDKVFPMDILPEYLIKAILARDIDRMEQLGIYEVAPEDFALAEHVDPSKIELQRIVREGLDYLRSEVG